MFLSVIVPIYNAEKVLDECINSIIMQNFDDYELILVNDGSKDRSLEICNRWKNQYPNKIRVINKDNSGALLTRRVGMEAAKGDYLYIPDADDYLIDNNAFKTFKEIISKNSLDILIFDITSNNKKEANSKIDLKKNVIYEGDNLLEVYDLLIKTDQLNSLLNKVFSKNIIDFDVDYTKLDKITNGNDLFQSIPLIFNAKRIMYINDVLYFYRYENNNSSIVHVFNKNIYNSLKSCFVQLDMYARNNRMLDQNENICLANKYMMIASTSAYKIRLADKNQDKSIYLASIGNDNLFREKYKMACLKELSIPRRVIVWLLYHHKYNMLVFLIRPSDLF